MTFFIIVKLTVFLFGLMLIVHSTPLLIRLTNLKEDEKEKEDTHILTLVNANMIRLFGGIMLVAISLTIHFLEKKIEEKSNLIQQTIKNEHMKTRQYLYKKIKSDTIYHL